MECQNFCCFQLKYQDLLFFVVVVVVKTEMEILGVSNLKKQFEEVSLGKIVAALVDSTE